MSSPTFDVNLFWVNVFDSFKRLLRIPGDDITAAAHLICPHHCVPVTGRLFRIEDKAFGSHNRIPEPRLSVDVVPDVNPS